MNKQTLLLALLLLVPNPTFGEESVPLKFTLESDRSTYATSDRVILRLEVENVSGDALDVVDFMQTQSWLLSAQIVTFEIKDAQGKVYPLQGPVTDYWPGDRVTRLDKGNKMETSLIINDPTAKNYFTMGLQSTYTITAFYQGWPNHTVESNAVTIILE